MNNAIVMVERPMNEPVLSYAPGSSEREALKASLKVIREDPIEIPLIIGGREVRTNNLGTCVIPHDHQHVLATYHQAGEKEVVMAAEAASKAAGKWLRTPWSDRLAIFKKAAELISGPYRMMLNAATILGQGKNVIQAEIDAACELTDFLRFNAHFARKIYQEQPVSEKGIWNQVEYRPLEGFVFALTPLNFTAIAGNLPTAPAMMGNTVLWKPASSAVFSAYYVMKIFQEAGLPDGVINFLPGSGGVVGGPVLNHPDLAGVHFTGSTDVFNTIWKTLGSRIDQYRSYPRIVGETGGKDFIFVHASARIDAVVTAMIRGAFEYQGQKCSAVSRAYIPSSLWPSIREKLLRELSTVTMGSPEDFRHLVNAVIDRNAFDRIRGYIHALKKDTEVQIIAGGNCDDSQGYFIEPTVALTSNPLSLTMKEEIFGPVLTLYVYDDADYLSVLDLCDTSSDYALTGAIFAGDRDAIAIARDKLVHAAGNFYINDKPTGAVVGQQPFGGARASGTNDKAGSILNLYRWVSPRTIKENFVPPMDYRYPFMSGA